MRSLPLSCLLLMAVAASGHKIGDSCSVSSDCATDGSRTCDTFSPGGSCTIQGCDFGTCPDEAVCVRFFPGLENAPECVGGVCEIDEVCTVGNRCAPRSIELRYCMPSCGSHGDCRDEYECRDKDLMIKHGGEPVPDPNKPANPDAKPQSFCASRRPCVLQSDCDPGDVCDLKTRICLPG